MVNSTNIFWYLLGKMSSRKKREDAEAFASMIHSMQKEEKQKRFIVDSLIQFRNRGFDSQNLGFIDGLIDKISSSRPISETEKRIVDLMSFLSFINSSVNKDIPQINVIQIMKKCLNRFTTYSDQFGKAMLDSHWNREDGPKFVVSENSVYVDQLKNELDELDRRFLEQKQSFEARHQSFSNEYALQTIFSSSLGFSEYFSFMRGFKTVMEDITKRFYDNKSRFVQFLQEQIKIRTDFVIEIRSNDLDFTGCDDFEVMNTFLETYPVEPVNDLREQLKRELETIELFQL
jgi:hypothetical protein